MVWEYGNGTNPYPGWSPGFSDKVPSAMGKGREKDMYDEPHEYGKEEYQYKKKENQGNRYFFNEGPRDYPVEFEELDEDPYFVLGVDRDATQAEIKKQFYKLASLRSCFSSGQLVLFDASVISIYFMINLRKKLRRLEQILQ